MRAPPPSSLVGTSHLELVFVRPTQSDISVAYGETRRSHTRVAGLVDARAAEAAGFTEGLAKNTATLRWGYQPQVQAAAPNEQPLLSQQRLEGSAVGEAGVAAAAAQESLPREAQVEASEQGATAEEPAASEGRDDTPLVALAPALDVAPVDAARDAVVDEPARVLSADDALERQAVGGE